MNYFPDMKGNVNLPDGRPHKSKGSMIIEDYIYSNQSHLLAKEINKFARTMSGNLTLPYAAIHQDSAQ